MPEFESWESTGINCKEKDEGLRQKPKKKKRELEMVLLKHEVAFKKSKLKKGNFRKLGKNTYNVKARAIVK